MKTRQDVINAGGILVEHRTGSTWNDGGSWNTWVYYLENGDLYIRVHQETDYRPDVRIVQVFPKVITTVEFEEN